MDDTESFPDYPAVPEEALHLSGGKGCADIEILGSMAKHNVTDGPAHNIGLTSGILNLPNSPQGIPVYHGISYGMLFCCIYFTYGNGFPVFVCFVSNEHV